MDSALRQTAKGILVTNAYQLSVAHLGFRMGMPTNPATIDRFIGPFYSYSKRHLRAYLPRIVYGAHTAAYIGQTGSFSRN